jgi:hypothetical protein
MYKCQKTCAKVSSFGRQQNIFSTQEMVLVDFLMSTATAAGGVATVRHINYWESVPSLLTVQMKPATPAP